MIKFLTQYDKRDPVYQDPGSRVKDVYVPRYSDRGVLDLEVSGTEDLYAYIQSHKESTDIHVLLDRFANGEVDVLQRFQGFYGDFSSMPKTYAEVLNAVIAGEEVFSRLPIDVKQRFDNSFAVWLSAMDQPDFADRMGHKAESTMTDQQIQDFTAPSTFSQSTPASVPTSTPEASS